MEAQAGGSEYKPFREVEDEGGKRATAAEGQEAADLERERQRVDLEYSSGDEELSAMDKQYAAQTNLPRRIHILGTGSIGKLVAHSLRGLPNPPPVTLLFHRRPLVDAWEQGKKQITIHDDGYDVARDGFEIELTPQERMEHGLLLQGGTPSVYDVATDEVRPHEAVKLIEQQQKSETNAQEQQDSTHRQPDEQRESFSKPDRYARYIASEPIHNLIVTTKTPYTVPALSRLKARILPTSTICFLQNGMGIVDEVNQKLFPDAKERPNYAQGIITHGANVPPEKAEQDPFYAVHAGHGTIALGLLPRDDVSKDSTGEASIEGKSDAKQSSKPSRFTPSSRYLLRTLTRSPILCAVGFTPTELLQQQLEKLVINSIINPLTSLLDARNGTLLYNFPLTRTMRLLIAETSYIIRKLPELQGVPNVHTRFSPERLETLVVSMANKTKDNISSMLADVRAGRQTEIEYINGYIVRRGEELGVKCVINYAIMQTVIGKAKVVDKERRGNVPSAEGGRRVEGSM